MQVHLICQTFRNVISMVKRVAIIGNVVLVLLVLTVSLCGGFADYKTGIFFSSAMLCIFIPLLIPGFYYEKVSQSVVKISYNGITVMDKKGRCWRTLSFDAITAIQIKEIVGFFYGQNRFSVKDHYICFFLNNTSKIPEVPFNKLFYQDDFFLVSYDKDLANFLVSITGAYQGISLCVTGDSLCMTGDGGTPPKESLKCSENPETTV